MSDSSSCGSHLRESKRTVPKQHGRGRGSAHAPSASRDARDVVNALSAPRDSGGDAVAQGARPIPRAPPNVTLAQAQDEYGDLLSVGSELHAQGTCRPCLYVTALVGCQKGKNCQYCHAPHPRKDRLRLTKHRRVSMARQLQRAALSQTQNSSRNPPERSLQPAGDLAGTISSQPASGTDVEVQARAPVRDKTLIEYGRLSF